MTCIEDLSTDDEADEEVSRSLDEMFQLCGRFVPTDAFRSTSAHSGIHRMDITEAVRIQVLHFDAIIVLLQ